MSPVVLVVVGAIYYDVNGGVLRWLLLFSAVQCSAVSLHTEGEIRSESSFSRGGRKILREPGFCLSLGEVWKVVDKLLSGYER